LDTIVQDIVFARTRMSRGSVVTFRRQGPRKKKSVEYCTEGIFPSIPLIFKPRVHQTNDGKRDLLQCVNTTLWQHLCEGYSMQYT